MSPRLWLLLVFALAGAFAPSRADARGAETCAQGFFATTTNARPESEPQVAGTHQGFAACGYESASGYSQAAETSTSDLVVFTKNGLGSGTLTTGGTTATLDVTVVVGDGQTLLSGLRSALQQAQASGASQLLINTGEVVDTDLAATWAQRAASGQGFLGGTVTSAGTSASGNPMFQILIKVGK